MEISRVLNGYSYTQNKKANKFSSGIFLKKKKCKAKFVVTYPQHGFCVNANFKFFLHFFQMWMRINRCSYEGKYSAIVLM